MVKKDDYKNKSGLYVLPGNRDANSSNFRMENIIVKVMKKVKKMEYFLKEIQANI